MTNMMMYSVRATILHT